MTVESKAQEDVFAKGYDPHVMRELVRYVAPYKLNFFISLLFMLLSSALAVAGPYLVKVALDDGIAKGSPSVLLMAVALYLGCAIFQWVFIYFRVYLISRVGQSIIYDLRRNLFHHLQKLSLSFFSHYSVGRLIVRVINDVNVIRQFLMWAVLAIARDFFTLFLTIAIMLSMNLRLSLVTFAVLPLMAFITAIFRKRARENYRQTRLAISWVNSVLAENINGVREVQAFSRENVNYGYFKDTVNQNNLSANLKAARLSSLFYPSIDFLGSLAMAAAIALGGTAVIGADITAGVLVAFVLYINRFFEPIRDLSQRYDSFQSTMASGERILSLLSTTVEIADAPDAIDLPVIEGQVSFKDLSFHYSDDKTPVLKNINLDVSPGETVALVGKTGAGKSTLAKLLARFVDPTEGCLSVDGIDLRTCTQSSLRGQMGIVLQDPFLFSGTIRENIRFGRLEASDAEVEDAARAVGADEFIRNTRLGYETPVEEGGVMLSVGQRQLISFARALLANPRILILDEATSSVDTQTEMVIQKALNRLFKGRTSFVIAHRLSTVVNADKIVVIEDGQIVEQGCHVELLAKNGAYFRLYSMRFEEQ